MQKYVSVRDYLLGILMGFGVGVAVTAVVIAHRPAVAATSCAVPKYICDCASQPAPVAITPGVSADDTEE